MRLAVVLALAFVLGALLGCDDDPKPDCDLDRPCGAGLTCTSGICSPIQGYDGGATDASPDATTPDDGGATDASPDATTPNDGGFASDARMFDRFVVVDKDADTTTFEAAY